MQNKISYILLIILVTAGALQFSAWGLLDENYTILRYIIIFTSLIIFVVSLKNIGKSIKRISLYKRHLSITITLSTVIFFLSAISLNAEMAPIRDLAVSLVFLSIGLNVSLSEAKYSSLIFIFVIFYTMSALSVVYTYASGFVINELYLPVPKNQISPAFGVAFILSLYQALRSKDKRIIYFILSGLLLSSMLVIRGRAVLVSVIISILALLFFYMKSKRTKFIFIIFIIALIPIIGESVYNAFFMNYDVTDLESVSAGRVYTYQEGIDFFMSNPLGGKLENQFDVTGVIHNYILYNFVNYGIIIGFMFASLLFSYFKLSYITIRNNSFLYYEAGSLAMVIPLIVSFFEYTYPFSPGSAVFFPFFLFGYQLRKINYG